MERLLEDLLAPVSEAKPCGPYVEDNTELYTLYNELESTAKGKQEQVMGDAVIAAVEPNWGKVQALSVSLLSKTKDLRVANYLTQALLNKNSFSGLRDGLSFIHLFLVQYWEAVHPHLVIDGDDDPDYRINAVSELGSTDFINSISNITLVASKSVGRFTLKDYRIATGALKQVSKNGEELKPNLSLINAAFLDVDIEVLQSNRAAVSESAETLVQIEKVFEEKLENISGPQVDVLKADLNYVIKIFDDILSQRGSAVAQELVQETHAPAGDSEMTQDQVPTNINSVMGSINSREDVVKQIDLICKYYEKNEPSSPVPLVLNRAKKLVTMDFMAIIKDVSPESLTAITSLAGIEE
tara:strand:+ start:20468 stop:21532 length:1065 start_codon:yes stop_codon:yes gene_type:complete